MYNAINSKYTYEGTDILKNRLGIKDEELLKEYETRIVAFKIATINSAKLPKGYTPERLKFINKYLFGEVYEFAGEKIILDFLNLNIQMKILREFLII